MNMISPGIYLGNFHGNTDDSLMLSTHFQYTQSDLSSYQNKTDKSLLIGGCRQF
jgi:hypothetical protein